jgi:hypothetical protein
MDDQPVDLVPYPQEDLCIAVAEGERISYVLIDMAYIYRGETENKIAPPASESGIATFRYSGLSPEYKSETKDTISESNFVPEVATRSDFELDYSQLPEEVYKRLEAYAALDLLCDFCLELRNLEWWTGGELKQVFCASCRSRINKHPIAECAGKSARCVKARYVDELGEIAPFCKECHLPHKVSNWRSRV